MSEEITSEAQSKDMLRIYCAICAGYHPPESMRGLPCGHVFCESGLENWFTTLNPPRRGDRYPRIFRKRLCPSCRAELELGDHLLPLFLQGCFARPDAKESETVYEETEMATDPPTGGPMTLSAGGYAEQVHKRARQAVECIKALDDACSSQSVQRAAERLLGVFGSMQTDEKDDHVKALLLAVATFLRDTVCKAYGALREKDRLVQESERKRARLGQEIGTLNEEASKREQLLEDAIATADRGASEAARLKGEVQKLEGAKQADKKKIAGLQMEAEQARSTERRLRNKVTDLEAELQKTTAELETQRESAEQQRQENEDLRQQSQIEYSFDEPGPLDAFGEFVQGSSRSQSWETSSVVYAEDIDLDSSPSRPSTPAPSASHSSRAPSVASSRVSSKTFRLRSTFSSQARMASGSGAVPQRPKFVSDWSLDPPASKRKRVAADESSKKFPIKVDANGRPIGQLQIGPRARLNKYN